MFSFCKPVSSKKRFLPYRVINENFSFSLYEKAEAIPANDWDAITQLQTFFLERDYLKIIEEAEHTKLLCRYVLVYHKQKVCGIIYYQVVDFKASVFGDIMDQQVESLRSHRMNLFERYLDKNKHEVLMRLFTCGNNLISGELGTLDNVRKASEIAILAGADFIKTSTGKIQPAATMPVTLVMLEAIKDHYHKTNKIIGMKPAGGISNSKTALQYLVMLNETLGSEWMTPNYFRFGASSLANDIILQLGKEQHGTYYNKDYVSLD